MSSVIKLLHGDLPLAVLLAWPLSNSAKPLISYTVAASRAKLRFVPFFSILQLVYKIPRSLFPLCSCQSV